MPQRRREFLAVANRTGLRIADSAGGDQNVWSCQCQIARPHDKPAATHRLDRLDRCLIKNGEIRLAQLIHEAMKNIGRALAARKNAPVLVDLGGNPAPVKPVAKLRRRQRRDRRPQERGHRLAIGGQQLLRRHRRSEIASVVSAHQQLAPRLMLALDDDGAHPKLTRPAGRHQPGRSSPDDDQIRVLVHAAKSPAGQRPAALR